jgi:hypothetical protein
VADLAVAEVLRVGRLAEAVVHVRRAGVRDRAGARRGRGALGHRSAGGAVLVDQMIKQVNAARGIDSGEM